MTAVETLYSSSAGGRDADRSNGGAFVSRQSWLRELELARRQEGLQSKVVEGSGHSTESGGHFMAEGRLGPTRVANLSPDGFRGVADQSSAISVSQRTTDLSVRTAPGALSDNVEIRFRAGGNGIPAQALPGAMASSAVIGNEPVPERTALGVLQRYTTPDWQKQNIHVVSAENTVQVWVRDPQLDRERSASLLAKLSASMRSIGKQLVALTINGRSVSGTTPRS